MTDDLDYPATRAATAGPYRCVGGPYDGRMHYLTPGIRQLRVAVVRRVPLKFYAENEPMPMELDPWGQWRMPRPPIDQYEYTLQERDGEWVLA